MRLSQIGIPLAAALLAGSPAAAETASLDFLGSVFSAPGAGVALTVTDIARESRIDDTVVVRNLRGGVVEELELPQGFFRSGDGVQTARFFSGGVRTRRGVEFFQVNDGGLRRLERSISSGGVERLNRARGYIASSIRKRERAR